MQSSSPKILILLGIIIVLIGVIWSYGGKYFYWVGRLPGDIKIEKENFKFYFPITTMILASILFSLILRLWRWLS